MWNSTGYRRWGSFWIRNEDVSKYLEAEKNIVLYAPESFEWLLLASSQFHT